MTEIRELIVGYHACKTNPFQRIICDVDWTNPYYECHTKDFDVFYSKEQPNHREEDVYEVCKDLDLIMKVAELNKDGIVATIRDGDIIKGDDIDIWKDIKVWVKGTYPKNQPNKLSYVKHSHRSRYLKSGINKIKMLTDKWYNQNNGHVLSFEIESSTFQDRYTVVYSGANRCKHEAYQDGYSGFYHGYHYCKSFEEVQDLFNEKYNVTLVKDGDTVYHRY